MEWGVCDVLSAPQHLRWSLSFCSKKRKQRKKMHKKRNMHDFPSTIFYQVLNMFVKIWGGGWGKSSWEAKREGWLKVVCLGALELWSGGLGGLPVQRWTYIFYSSSVWWKGSIVCPLAPPMIPPSHYHPTSPPAHTLTSLNPHSFL